MSISNIFIYSWSETPNGVLAWGIDSKENNTCLRFQDFNPWLYEDISNEKGSVGSLLRKRILKLKSHGVINAKIVRRKKLYYAHQDPKGKDGKKWFTYIRYEMESRKKLRWMLWKNKNGGYDKKPWGYIFHETCASDVLQLTTLYDIPVCGWCTVRGTDLPPTERISTCVRELNVLGNNVIRSQEGENLVTPSPLIMSFDIEVYSSVAGTFPDARREDDAIFQIGCIFSKLGDPVNSGNKVLLTLSASGGGKIESKGIEVREYGTELELLLGWIDLIKERDPHIIAGYNIFGFDIPYILDRAELRYLDEITKFSMLVGENCPIKEINWNSSAYGKQDMKYIESHGRIFMDLLPMIRRDYKFDTYKLDFVAKYFLNGQSKDDLSPEGIFRCYERGVRGGEEKCLEVCGRYCIQDTQLVLELFVKLQTWYYLTEMASVCNIPIFHLYTRGQQIRLYSQLYRHCFHKDIVVEQDVYKLNGDETYQGAICFDPIPGIYEMVVPLDFASLYPSVVISHNIDYTTLVKDPTIPDSQCHIIEWEEHTNCSHDPKIQLRENINTEVMKLKEVLSQKQERRIRNRISSKGVKARLRTEKLDLEIQNLKKIIKTEMEKRPAISKAEKVCVKRRYRWLKEPMGVVPTLLLQLLDARSKTKKIMRKQQSDLDRYKQDCLDSGTPIDTGFVAAATRDIDILNKRQLAYKVSCNSAYGVMGVRKGILPFLEGAMCITAKGRESTRFAAHTIQTKFGGKLIYGDTDSTYIVFPQCKTATQAWDEAERVAKKVSDMFPKHMTLEFEEEVYQIFCILSKKRYMSISTDRNGKVATTKNKLGQTVKKIHNKGVLLARRDNSPWTKNLYRQVMRMIFDKHSHASISYHIIQELNKLCRGEVPIQELSITKKVGHTDVDSNGRVRVLCRSCNQLPSDCGCRSPDFACGSYKISLPKSVLQNSRTPDWETQILSVLPSQVQLAFVMKSRGRAIQPGSRIPFIISNKSSHESKISERIESTTWFSTLRRMAPHVNIDYFYYIKSIINPLDQLLNVVTKDRNLHYLLEKQYLYRYKIRKQCLDEISQPFQYILDPTTHLK